MKQNPYHQALSLDICLLLLIKKYVDLGCKAIFTHFFVKIFINCKKSLHTMVICHLSLVIGHWSLVIGHVQNRMKGHGIFPNTTASLVERFFFFSSR